MSDERRYSDSEVAHILEHASARQAALQRDSAGNGLTLAQLQEVAAEVGIAPDIVARAAAQVSHGNLVPTRISRLAGIPIGVARTVELNRDVSDDEWDELVATLRMTFNANGKVRSDGRLRSWSNGNLRAVLEPAERGHRLRLSTVKGNARPLLGFGITMLAASAAVFALSISGSLDGPSIGAPIIGAVFGTGTIAGTITSLRNWSRRRSEQMEAIAERTAERTPASAPGKGVGEGSSE